MFPTTFNCKWTPRPRIDYLRLKLMPYRLIIILSVLYTFYVMFVQWRAQSSLSSGRFFQRNRVYIYEARESPPRYRWVFRMWDTRMWDGSHAILIPFSFFLFWFCSTETAITWHGCEDLTISVINLQSFEKKKTVHSCGIDACLPFMV